MRARSDVIGWQGIRQENKINEPVAFFLTQSACVHSLSVCANLVNMKCAEVNYWPIMRAHLCQFSSNRWAAAHDWIKNNPLVFLFLACPYSYQPVFSQGLHLFLVSSNRQLKVLSIHSFVPMSASRGAAWVSSMACYFWINLLGMQMRGTLIFSTELHLAGRNAYHACIPTRGSSQHRSFSSEYILLGWKDKTSLPS